MKKKSRVSSKLLEIMMWLLSLTILYPLGMVVLTSFKSYGEASFLTLSIPKQWHFENYVLVFKQGKILNSFLNSTYITILSVILIVSLTSMLSFILMRKRTKLNRLIYKFMTFGIIAPFAALPTIELLKMIGLYGSRTSLVFVYTALFMPFSTLLYSSFIVTIPKELDEAAVIDGCTGMALFLKIVFPLLQPITVTVAVLNFMWVWNDFQYPIFLLNSSDKWTLPLSVYNFFGQYNHSWQLVCTDMVMVSLPVVILYLFAQKYIISGMTAGAVKG
jgi:raffinose/stachyose/melibiose transport system permease protein